MSNTHAGQATIIQHPYDGVVPSYIEPESRIVPTIEGKTLSEARSRINFARVKEQRTGKSFRNFLTDIYERIFQDDGGQRSVLVSGTYMEQAPYYVMLNKNAVGKVISDANMTPEKLAVLEALDVVVANGEYVGSGQYIPKSAKAKKTIRYDYFETPIVIDGQGYIVTFDVEVFPNTNNYRTHKVINEMDLIPVYPEKTGAHQSQDTVRADVGTHQPQGTGEQSPSVNVSISNLLQKVKATAAEVVERPEGLPESLLEQFRPLLEKQTVEAERAALAKLLGRPDAAQDPALARFLDDQLAAAKEYVRLQTLDLSPEVQEHYRSVLEQGKEAAQWIVDHVQQNQQHNKGTMGTDHSEELTKDAVGGILPKKQGGRRFPSEELLTGHHKKHMKQFGEISVEEYLDLANALADSPLSDDVVQLVRSDGSISKYCFSTNEFVVVDPDGTIKTFFKPEKGRRYWQDELDRN